MLADDALWSLGLPDIALIGICAAVMVLASIGIVVWAAAVPEKALEPEVDHAGEIVARARARTEQVEHDLEDQTGRSDPAVAWTR